MAASRETKFRVRFDVEQGDLRALQRQIQEITRNLDRMAVAADAAASGINNVGAGGGVPAPPGPSGPSRRAPDPRSIGRNYASRYSPGSVFNSLGGAISPELGGMGHVMSLAGGGVISAVGGGGMGALRAGGIAATIALIGGVLAKGISDAKNYMIAMGDVSRQVGELTDGTRDFGNVIKDNLSGLSLTTAEMERLTKQYVGLAGVMKGVGAGGEVGADIRIATGFGRAFGIGPTAGVSAVAGLKRLGIGTVSEAEGNTIGPPMSTERMVGLLSEAIVQGRMGGREEEMINAIKSLVTIQTRNLLTPMKAVDIISLMTALNSTNIPGFKGELGANLINQVGMGIQHPGGGAYGQYLSYKIMGGGDYAQYLYNREEGAAHIPKVIGGLNQELAGIPPMYKNLAASRILGITMHQAEGLLGAQDILGGGARFGEFAQDIEKRAGGRDFDWRKAQVLARLYQARQKGASERDIRDILTSEGYDKETARQMAAKGATGAYEDVLSKSFVETEGDKTRKTIATVQEAVESLGETVLRGFNSTIVLLKDIWDIVPSIDRLGEWWHGLTGPSQGGTKYDEYGLPIPETGPLGPDPSKRYPIPKPGGRSGSMGGLKWKGASYTYGGAGFGGAHMGGGSGGIDQWSDLINYTASYYGLDPALVAAIMEQESGGKPWVTGSSGEYGLMQLMPGTYARAAEALGLSGSPYDVYNNLMAGGYVLNENLRSGKGLDWGIRAYNSGPRGANRGKSTGYAASVMNRYSNIRQRSQMKTALPRTPALPPVQQKAPPVQADAGNIESNHSVNIFLDGIETSSVQYRTGSGNSNRNIFHTI